MQIQILINGRDMSANVYLPETRISKDLGGYNSTATIGVNNDPSLSARYGTATYGAATYAVQVQELDDIQIKDSGTGAILFGGYAADVSLEYFAPNFTRIHCGCQDYGAALDQILITQTWTNTTNRAIIQSIIGSFAPGYSALTANIGQYVTTDYDARGVSIKRILSDLAEQANAEFRVDGLKNVYFFKPAANPAPWGLSTEYDNVTTFEYQIKSYRRTFTAAANLITYIGGIYPLTGHEITYTTQDLQSQQRYGIKSSTVVDRSIIDPVILQLHAQTDLLAKAWPDETGAVTIWKDGLEVGQQIAIKSSIHGFSGSYTIRRLNLSWDDNTRTRYDCEFGPYTPDLVRLLRLLNAATKAPSILGVTIPADGSVTPSKIADRAVQTVHIAVQAVITELLALGAVDDTILANDSVTTPKLITNAVIASKIGAGEVIAGKLGADSVIAGNMAVGSIRGVDAVFVAGAIATADIGNAQITTAKIGNLAVDQANLQNVSVIDAKIGSLAVTTAKIDNLAVGTLQLADLAVTNAKIANLAVSKLTAGTVSVASVNAGITIAYNANSAFSYIVPAGFGVADANGFTCSALTVHGSPFAGRMELFNAGISGPVIDIDADTGYIRAYAAFVVGLSSAPHVGQSVTINYTKVGGAAGTMTFQGGILTGNT